MTSCIYIYIYKEELGDIYFYSAVILEIYFIVNFLYNLLLAFFSTQSFLYTFIIYGAPSLDRNNAVSDSALPPVRETLTESERGGSIFDSSGESASTASNHQHSYLLVRDQAFTRLG